MKDIYYSLDAGNTKEAQKIINDIYNVKLKNGVEKTDAKSSIKSGLTGKYKELYITGSSMERLEIKEMLMNIYIDGKRLYSQDNFTKWNNS